jgi:hypothetical protein
MGHLLAGGSQLSPGSIISSVSSFGSLRRPAAASGPYAASLVVLRQVSVRHVSQGPFRHWYGMTSSGFSFKSAATVFFFPDGRLTYLEWLSFLHGWLPFLLSFLLSRRSFLLTTLRGPNRKHRSQQLLHCCLCIRCRGKPVYRVVS